MMVCMGWEDKFNALNKGAPGGDCSFLFATAEIWKVDVSINDGGSTTGLETHSLSIPAALSNPESLEELYYSQRLKTPNEINRLYSIE